MLVQKYQLLKKPLLNSSTLSKKSPQPLGCGDFFIHVNPKNQTLSLISIDNNQIIRSFNVSTAKNGLGEELGSYKTPRGWHIIRAKVGDNAPERSVFVGRRPTGEIYNKELHQQEPDRDWMLTRILWLSGLEVGKNRLGNVDSMRRYIYIHGGPDDDINGTTSSHGCVKMRNKEVIELFDMVPAYTKVFIGEEIYFLS